MVLSPGLCHPRSPHWKTDSVPHPPWGVSGVHTDREAPPSSQTHSGPQSRYLCTLVAQPVLIAMVTSADAHWCGFSVTLSSTLCVTGCGPRDGFTRWALEPGLQVNGGVERMRNAPRSRAS